MTDSKMAAKQSQGESWGELAKTVISAGLIAIVIRTFLFQPFNIPSGSMENTLLVGDYLFVAKFSYGYSRYTFPFGGWPFGEKMHGRFMESQPQRGDVVVFKFPQDNSTDYIKRVIGLPGDRVQMINDILYLNGKPVPRERVEDFVGALDGDDGHWKQYRETLPGGKSYVTLDKTTDGQLDNTELFTVPAGHYFMMGDNRDNSNDSRDAVGMVPAENLEGKALFRFFSISCKWGDDPTLQDHRPLCRIPNILGWIRYSRLLTPIH